MTAIELGRHGGDRRSDRAKSKSRDCNARLKSGTAAHWLARLDRDGCTELAVKVRAGEMSAHEAAIQMGWRKRPDPVPAIQRLCSTLNREEWRTVLSFVSRNFKS